MRSEIEFTDRTLVALMATIIYADAQTWSDTSRAQSVLEAMRLLKLVEEGPRDALKKRALEALLPAAYRAQRLCSCGCGSIRKPFMRGEGVGDE